METSVVLSIMFEILRCKHNAKDLASEFEVSERTVYRYVDSLCGAGVPIISSRGRNGGFSMLENYKIHEFFLTKNEKEYLLNFLKKQNNENAKYIWLKINSLATL